ncbi:hypothetical protein M8C21_023177, partial [Ambrosia artemisiifolia]
KRVFVGELASYEREALLHQSHPRGRLRVENRFQKAYAVSIYLPDENLLLLSTYRGIQGKTSLRNEEAHGTRGLHDGSPSDKSNANEATHKLLYCEVKEIIDCSKTFKWEGKPLGIVYSSLARMTMWKTDVIIVAFEF